MVFERQQERPTEIEANRARLARASKTILKDVPDHAVNFGTAAAILMGEPNGDAVIAGMIEFAGLLAQEGLEVAFTQIERTSGMTVQIEHSREDAARVGYLVAIEGIGGSDDQPPGRKKYLRGVAVVEDRRGREFFMPVGISENGTVFLIPQEPTK